MPMGMRPLDLLIILAVALLIFGPKKLPEIGASIGKSISSFKKGMKEVEEGKVKEELQEQAQLEQKRLDLAALEREIASKKAAASVYEAAQAEHVEANTSDSKLG
jgi:sec-independent protein translocase protein TatA